AAPQEPTDRASDMSRLVALGQALARSLDAESIRAAAAAHLPLLVPGRGIWGVLCLGSDWPSLVVVGDSSPAQREAAACRLLGFPAPGGPPSNDVCFPMLVADTPVGAVGVSPSPALTPHQERMIAAAAALLVVSHAHHG